MVVQGSLGHPEDSSNSMEAGALDLCENALYFIIGFSFAMNFVDNSLSRAVREELIQVPLSTACSVVLFIGTLGADDFVDFCEGFFLELLYGIAERLILGSLMEAGEKSVAQGIHWVKTRSWFWRLALIVTGGDPNLIPLLLRAMARKWLQKRNGQNHNKMVMEGTPIEEAMEEVIGCGTTCMSLSAVLTLTLQGTVMTPFIILAIFFFAEETEIPAQLPCSTEQLFKSRTPLQDSYNVWCCFTGNFSAERQVPFERQYDIRSTDLVCYLLFGLIIAPFQATELQNNVRIYDYMLYAKWRWRNRVTRWLFDDPRLDLSIAEPLQSVNHLAFSPQFYFIETYYTWGMLVSLLSITIFLRKSRRGFMIRRQMILLNYILDRLIRWLISSVLAPKPGALVSNSVSRMTTVTVMAITVLWKPMDNSNFRIFSRSVALALQRKEFPRKEKKP
ncbi:unnamed protein product [Symbiodinium sp. KB8]|nr:unnamed protein product [Symbiodinium sp. KB8]